MKSARVTATFKHEIKSSHSMMVLEGDMSIAVGHIIWAAVSQRPDMD